MLHGKDVHIAMIHDLSPSIPSSFAENISPSSTGEPDIEQTESSLADVLETPTIEHHKVTIHVSSLSEEELDDTDTTATTHFMNEHLSHLEQAAQMAIDTILTESRHRIDVLVDQVDTRVLDALSMVDEQQQTLHNWQQITENELQKRIANADAHQFAITEQVQRMERVRTAAEASLAITRGDLEQQWNLLRTEMSTHFAQREQEEQLRWEQFRSSVMLQSSSADQNSEHIQHVSAELAKLRDDTGSILGVVHGTLNNLQQHQQGLREQVTAVRSETHALLESEHANILESIENRLVIAGTKMTSQAQSLQETLHRSAAEFMKVQDDTKLAERRLQDILSEQEINMNSLRRLLDQEIFQLHSMVREETEKILQEQTVGFRHAQLWQSITFVMTIVALVVATGAFALTYLHH